MLQRDGVVMVEMKVLVIEMMTMMIRRAFLSLVFFTPQRRRCLYLSPP
jgi:hypothetical protein